MPEVALIAYSVHRNTSLSIVVVLMMLAASQSIASAENARRHVGVSNDNATFGKVRIGSSKNFPDSLTNHTESSITVSSIEGLGADFLVTGISLPLVVAPGQKIPFNVEFQPTNAGSTTTTISFLGENGQAYVSLSASGTAVSIGKLLPNPAPVAFSNTNVGSNQTSTVSLTNNGGTDLVITNATMSGAGFALNNLALPMTLPSGTATSATITFAPTDPGNFNGSVTFGTKSSEIQDNVNISLSGLGITPANLAPNPSSLAFGDVPVGSTVSLPENLINLGGGNITISQATASGSGFSFKGLSLPVTLTPGQIAALTVVFTPTSSGAVTGSLSITSNGPDPHLSIPLSGTGMASGTLAANPSSLSFGTVQVNSSANLSEILTNTSASSVTISQANVTGAGFSITGLNLPLTLTANQSVTFSATFAPTTSGTSNGMLSVVSNASNSPLSVALTGTAAAAGQLAVSPSSLSFGNVAVGSSASLSGKVSASGSSITVSSAGLNNPEFTVSGISLPATLVAGQSATFNVTFTPQSSGAASASLSFVSNAVNSPAVETLTGTGTTATQHTVDLSWTASPDVVGYNIYRSTVSGGPYSMINGSLDSATSYVDNTVVSGQTYYYVATAVNSDAQESGYSNEAQAVVPNP